MRSNPFVMDRLAANEDLPSYTLLRPIRDDFPCGANHTNEGAL
jgi:hypothetical protein